MKKVGIFKESAQDEHRISMVPAVALKLALLGYEVLIEEGLGEKLFFTNDEYTQSKALVVNRKRLFDESDIFLHLRPPEIEEVKKMKKNSLLISFLNPFENHELIRTLAKEEITSLALEFIPRTTLAQKMDTLSSQANLAGYFAVIKASEILGKILPMMTTPAGTLSPAKVFIIGVGVAGLQAIATAKRLGASVEATDTRPAVEEQVKSLGAKFVKMELGTTSQTKDGYAVALTEEQLNKQKEALTKKCQEMDIIITTAQVFGKKAPQIITKEMVKKMKKGSVLVDMSTETGGNVEGSLKGEIIQKDGVTIIGFAQLANFVAKDSSTLFANNLFHLLKHFWKEAEKSFNLDLSQEILKDIVITHSGKIVSPKIQGV